jgi:effector-binding domain-containing protein
MFDMLKDQGIEAAASPFGIFHGAINEQEDGPLEICLPVNGHVTGKGNVQVKELPGGEAACVMTVGAQTDFPAILGAYDAAADWIQKNGYSMAEPPREVWHNNNPGEELRMEIVWLYK